MITSGGLYTFIPVLMMEQFSKSQKSLKNKGSFTFDCQLKLSLFILLVYQKHWNSFKSNVGETSERCGGLCNNGFV